MHGRIAGRALAGIALLMLSASASRAQDTQNQTHDMSHMDMPSSAWTFMQDGVFDGMLNHQGGPRGGTEATAINWWMGMLSRSSGRQQWTLNGMFSLDPVTAGKGGYRELFQAGEAVNGRPNVDHQHPHDVFMQLSAVWTLAVSDETSVTIAGAPVGEPALGPVAFMHRASAAAIPFAPLSHHTFDSTHISFGVVTGSVSRGPWTVEGSLFNGREPDSDRWDFDFGKMDAVAGRIWFRPKDAWAFQVSTGRLVQPEELERGNVVRTTASVSWFRAGADAFSAMTMGYGRNDNAGQQAAFGEYTRQRGPNTWSSRVEVLQIENDLYADGVTAGTTGHATRLDVLGALTLGGIRRIGRWRGIEGGLGASVSVYAVPGVLHATHGDHPVSFQLFFQLRPHVGGMGPMWNMRMGQ